MFVESRRSIGFVFPCVPLHLCSECSLDSRSLPVRMVRCYSVAALVCQHAKSAPGFALQYRLGLQCGRCLVEQLPGFAPELAIQTSHASEVAQGGILRIAALGGFNPTQPGWVDGIKSGFEHADQLAA